MEEEGAKVLWSGEIDSANMIILDLSPEELKGLNLPCLEDELKLIPESKSDKESNDSALTCSEDCVDKEVYEPHAGSECDAASDDSDSDYIPEHEHASSDFELSSVCSQDKLHSGNKKIFKTSRPHKPTFKYTSVYEFQDEEEKEEQEYLEDEDEDVDGTGTLKTARTNNKQGRRWDKMNACKFCLWLGTGKLLLHLEAKHKENEEVKNLLKYKKDPKIKLKTKEEILADKPRKEMLTKLLGQIRNDGMQKHNMRLLVNGKVNDDPKKNVMLVKRRDAAARSYDDVVHCTKCNVCISRHQLAVHMKKAHSIEPGRNCQSQARACDPVAKSLDKDFQEKVMDSLRMGKTRLQIRRDKLIIRKGEKLFASQNWEDQPRHIETCRNRMRELARLVRQARKFDPKLNDLEELMVPQKYDLVVVATKELCVYNERKKIFSKGSLAKQIGHSLNSCIGILRGQYIREENEEKLRRLQHFESLMQEWRQDISRHALRSIYLKRQSKPLCFPLAKDVQNFGKFLKRRAAEAYNNLEEEVTLDSFKILCEVVYIQVTMFNRRRSGDIEHMLLDTYVNRLPTETHEDISEGLSELEKALLHHLTLIKTPGKRGKLVPVLLTKHMKNSLDLLCKTRAQLPELDNQFLFPAKTKLQHVHGCSIFRRMANEAELVKPEFVRSRNLRTHVGTMSQILNLGKSGLRILSKLMGHSEDVHAKFYELQEDTIMLAKASKVLFAIERGIMKYKGMSLDEIEISLDEQPEEDNNNDDDEEDALDVEKDDPEDIETEEKKKRKIKLSSHDKPQVKKSNIQPEDEESDDDKSDDGPQAKKTKTQPECDQTDTDDDESDDDKSDDDKSDDETKTPPKRRKPTAKGKQIHVSWEEDQLKNMKRFFIEELSSVGDYAGNLQPIWPKQLKCLKFLKKEGIKNRHWKDVKNCIANDMKKIMKKKTTMVKKRTTVKKTRKAKH